MLANKNPQRCRPASVRDSEAEGCPPVAAMPEAVARLQLLASSPVAELEAITSVIRHDEALTVGLLQLAADVVRESDHTVSVEELVIHLGLEELRRMAAKIALAAPAR